MSKIRQINTKISSQLLQSLGKSIIFAQKQNKHTEHKQQEHYESKRNRLLNGCVELGICPTILINVECLTNKHREGCAVLAHPSFVCVL